MSSTPLTRQSIHREILAEIDAPCLYASFKQGGTAVNSGLGVLDGPYFGLFDVLTGAAFRNRGFGTRFVAGMLAWAKARYASTAYLQVMEENEPARRMYARLGFQAFYMYWYRVPG